MKKNDDQVLLKVAGKIHSEWKSVDIQTSIESPCSAFKLTCSSIDPISANRISITPTEPCTVSIGDTVIVSGFIETDEDTIDPDDHEVSIGGRDRTADLVDCSCYIPDGPLLGVWIGGVPGLQILSEICHQFSIPVTADVDVGTAFRFALQPGEKAWTAIERLCRLAGVLPITDGLGGLHLTHGGTGGQFSSVQLGKNIQRSGLMLSSKDIYSDYIVITQTAGGMVGPEDSLVLKGVAKDPTMNRFRPLVIIAEGVAPDAETLTRRAMWEASVRRGRSKVFNATVNGWKDDNGHVWQINGLLDTASSAQGIQDSLLIAGARFIEDDQGQRTELKLMPPDAFTLIPIADGMSGYQVGGIEVQ